MTFRSVFPVAKPIIGVIHLPPLPGYAGSPGLGAVIDKALTDLEALERGGADGALVENENDRPHRVEASRETIAVMTRVARELGRARTKLPIGVEILLHDPEASIAVAHAAGGVFIRTDYFVDPMERPEYGGAMRIDPKGWLGYRDALGAEDVLVLADLQVKYARMTIERTLEESARLAVAERADALIVTGKSTGDPPGVQDIRAAKRGANGVPVFIGSGLDAADANGLMRVADGAIVGTSLQEEGFIRAERVRALIARARAASAS
jgi:membrane complex biogenesis BtpA family protein